MNRREFVRLGISLLGTTFLSSIAFSDENISTADILGAVSTALALVSLVGIFFPPALIVSGIAGVASCVIGLVTVAVEIRSTGLLILNVDGGRRVYLYLEENN